MATKPPFEVREARGDFYEALSTAHENLTAADQLKYLTSAQSIMQKIEDHQPWYASNISKSALFGIIGASLTKATLDFAQHAQYADSPQSLAALAGANFALPVLLSAGAYMSLNWLGTSGKSQMKAAFDPDIRKEMESIRDIICKANGIDPAYIPIDELQVFDIIKEKYEAIHREHNVIKNRVLHEISHQIDHGALTQSEMEAFTDQVRKIDKYQTLLDAEGKGLTSSAEYAAELTQHITENKQAVMALLSSKLGIDNMSELKEDAVIQRAAVAANHTLSHYAEASANETPLENKNPAPAAPSP